MAERGSYVNWNMHQQQFIAARFEVLATPPTSPVPGQQYFNATSNTFQGWNGTAWIDLSQIIANATTIKGEIANAGTSPAYPAAPSVGDTYFVTTQAGTVGGQAVEVGDQLVYSNSGWFILQRNLSQASQTLAGFLRLSTAGEVQNGADPTSAVSPATLAAYMVYFLYPKKVRVLVSSLGANNTAPITHGLNLANMEDFHAVCWQGGQQIELQVTPTTVNALTVTSNQTLSNVTVVIIG